LYHALTREAERTRFFPPFSPQRAHFFAGLPGEERGLLRGRAHLRGRSADLAGCAFRREWALLRTRADKLATGFGWEDFLQLILAAVGEERGP
jgi:hypothetical protein